MIQDDASKWYESQGQQIQDFEVPPMPEPEPGEEGYEEIPDEERPYGDAPTVTREDVNNVLNMQQINRPTASVIVGVMDSVLPIVITLIFKGAERDAAKLSSDEREVLTDAWAAYLGTKNVQASPGAVLLTTIATIYGAKVFDVMQQRKIAHQEERIAMLEAERAKYEDDLKRYEAELEALRKAANDNPDKKEGK